MNPAMRDIVVATAEHFNMSAELVTGRKRARQFSHPRHIAMVLCRRVSARSICEIAAFFGRDHTTVIHATKNIDTMLAVNPASQSILDKITAIARAIASDRQNQEQQWVEDFNAGKVSTIVPRRLPVAEQGPPSRVRWIMVLNRSPVRGPRRPIALPSEFAPPTKARLMGARA